MVTEGLGYWRRSNPTPATNTTLRTESPLSVLRRANPTTGKRMSFRDIAGKLADAGHTAASGKPLSPSVVRRLVEGSMPYLLQGNDSSMAKFKAAAAGNLYAAGRFSRNRRYIRRAWSTVRAGTQSSLGALGWNSLSKKARSIYPSIKNMQRCTSNSFAVVRASTARHCCSSSDALTHSLLA